METRKVSPAPISPADFSELKPGDVCDTFLDGKVTITGEYQKSFNCVYAEKPDGKKDIYFNFEIKQIISKY